MVFNNFTCRSIAYVAFSFICDLGLSYKCLADFPYTAGRIGGDTFFKGFDECPNSTFAIGGGSCDKSLQANNCYYPLLSLVDLNG